MGENMNERKTVYNLYALYGVSLVLCVLPYVSAAVLSVVFITALMIWAYVVRGKAEEHSLSENHATFVIRSLWIGVLISVITTILASLYMFQGLDYMAFNPCAESIAGMGIEAVEALNMQQFYDLAAPCIDDFIVQNKSALMVSVAIAGGPPLIYLAYRFIKGVSRARGGYRIAEPKAWL